MMYRVVVAMLALVATSSIASAQYNQFVGFGDSTVDSGWWKGALAGNCGPVSGPCTTGSDARDLRIGNAISLNGTGSPVGVGKMHSEWLADMYGLTALPANQPGGTNYAISGSLTNELANGKGNLQPNNNLPSTVQQIQSYLAANPVANSEALFMIGTGSNDISYAVDPLNNLTTAAARQDFLLDQIAALTQELKILQNAGAQHLLIDGTQRSEGLHLFYNDKLQESLAAAGVHFTFVNVAAFFQDVKDNPAKYGYTALSVLPGEAGAGAATTSACGAGPGAEGWGQFCGKTTTPGTIQFPHAWLTSLTSPQTSFYSDDGHLSDSGSQWLALYEYNILSGVPEPSTWAMIILGFAGMGALAWRRSRKAGAAFAAA